LDQWIKESKDQWFNESMQMSQWVSELVNQVNKGSMNQWINWSIDQ